MEFGFEARALFQGGSSLDQQFVEDDVDHITNVLFATVADPERIIELTDAQLLQRLGWAERFEYRNPHQFSRDGEDVSGDTRYGACVDWGNR